MKIYAFLALLLLSACASVNDGAMTSFPGLAPSEPPPPLAEMIPVIQNPEMTFWRPGYWAYDGRTFTWTSGHLAVRPHPTSVWSPEHWEKRVFGWAFVPGYWR